MHQILTISTSAPNFLTVKELTCIMILTKDALSGVGRLLVEVLLYKERNILKLQKKNCKLTLLRHVSLKHMFDESA